MSAKRLAAALVAFAGAAARPAARGSELLRTGAWPVASLAGTGFGLALSSSLISTLR